jgi:hypothetical protein
MDHARVIPCGIAPGTIRQKEGLAAYSYRLLYVARLSEEKDPMTALRAIQDIGDASRIDLEQIDARLPLQDGSWVQVDAAAGTFDPEANTLDNSSDAFGCVLVENVSDCTFARSTSGTAGVWM